MDSYPAVAIDGPAASGKSTVARRVASELGYTFVNSGAMYRVVTLWMIQNGIDLTDPALVAAKLPEVPLVCGVANGLSTLTLAGLNVDDQLGSDAVNAGVSLVASVPEIRQHLVALQQNYRTLGPVVMEGRDIGTVVFPDTPLKYYIDASEEVRAARRAAQGLHDVIAERDRIDSTRKASPLKIADGALVIDSSHLSVEQVVERVVADIKARTSA